MKEESKPLKKLTANAADFLKSKLFLTEVTEDIARHHRLWRKVKVYELTKD